MIPCHIEVFCEFSKPKMENLINFEGRVLILYYWCYYIF